MVHVIVKGFSGRTPLVRRDKPNASNTRHIVDDQGTTDVKEFDKISKDEEQKIIHEGLEKAVKEGDSATEHVYKKILNNTKNGN
jgi:hypothetical protein